jgi:outer membrane protein assembly factor BamA
MELRPVRHVEVGAIAGGLWYNVGPGIRPDVGSTERFFRQPSTPGIHEQTNFWRGGAYARFDSRTRPYLSGRGTQLQIRYDKYADRERAAYSFGVLQVDAQQAISFLNEKRVLALRASTALSYTGSNNAVPFYLQQTLGGPNDLRGFRLFRFTDNNKLVLNSEYRWEVAPPLELAIFADAGKVFARAAQLDLTALEGSAGFGIRLKTRSATAVRLDTAFSREGFQIWFRFSDIF